MLEGRWKMLDVAIRIHMSKEIRNLGESFDVGWMMEDV